MAPFTHIPVSIHRAASPPCSCSAGSTADADPATIGSRRSDPPRTYAAANRVLLPVLVRARAQSSCWRSRIRVQSIRSAEWAPGFPAPARNRDARASFPVDGMQVTRRTARWPRFCSVWNHLRHLPASLQSADWPGECNRHTPAISPHPGPLHGPRPCFRRQTRGRDHKMFRQTGSVRFPGYVWKQPPL